MLVLVLCRPYIEDSLHDCVTSDARDMREREEGRDKGGREGGREMEREGKEGGSN